MANEDFDKHKLKPLLEEAYLLLVDIEKKTNSKEGTHNKLDKQRKKLEERRTKVKGFKEVEDMQENTQLLFKSIMCPLGAKCPKDNRTRWPSSSTKTVTPFGRNCLYAHHYLELEFPETLNTKISAISTMKKLAGKKAEGKALASKDTFKPASNLADCRGCHNCNFCRFKQ